MTNEYWAGKIIRDLRHQRRLTGEDLAKKTGLSQSKISRIETGDTRSLQPIDIEKILNILEASSIIRQQINSAVDQSITGTPQRFKLHYPHDEPLQLEKSARIIRVFNIGLIPVLLQTTEFRIALLKNIGQSESDIREGMQTSIKRQDLLWQKDRRYHFILLEAALYTRPTNKKVQIAQLDRVERFIGLQNIKVGIIPLEAGLAVTENCSFALYDSRSVLKSLAEEDYVSKDADTLAVYQKLFMILDRLADYGDGASKLIHKAMKHFS